MTALYVLNSSDIAECREKKKNLKVAKIPNDTEGESCEWECRCGLLIEAYISGSMGLDSVH